MNKLLILALLFLGVAQAQSMRDRLLITCLGTLDTTSAPMFDLWVALDPIDGSYSGRLKAMDGGRPTLYEGSLEVRFNPARCELEWGASGAGAVFTAQAALRFIDQPSPSVDERDSERPTWADK